MMTLIKNLPAGTVGIEAHGKITHEDYQRIVIPSIEQALKENKKIKLLYAIEDFDGMELSAMWDDTRFGLSHWHDFTHLALVSDVAWIKNMTAFFAWMIPAQVKIFPADEMEQAKAWLGAQEVEKAA
ncbi:MAG: STAS/SEC14 domain-containing protein [Alphaproteobacteria bacterium]|nr:STAS/SEC14 domain-containing protein [Alphaproteobacteria bacterium]